MGEGTRPLPTCLPATPSSPSCRPHSTTTPYPATPTAPSVPATAPHAGRSPGWFTRLSTRPERVPGPLHGVGRYIISPLVPLYSWLYTILTYTNGTGQYSVASYSLLIEQADTNNK